MAELTRREFLKVVGTGAMAAGLGVLPAGCALQEGREVPILGIFPYTGSLAQNGPSLERGMTLALEEANNRILDRPIKFIKRDDETNAGAATRRVEEAVDSEGVRFVIGPWSSGVALAVSEVAKRRKVVHLFSGGTEDISGKRCHRYSFQWASHPFNACSIVVANFLQ
jgi:branched-chain amino acid transport system substrate-binding protein